MNENPYEAPVVNPRQYAGKDVDKLWPFLMLSLCVIIAIAPILIAMWLIS